MANKEQITRAILSMRYLPNSPITPANIPEIVSMFEVVLSDLPAETVDATTRQYLGTETFFPTPGRLREIAMDLQMLAMGVPTPAEAWGMVLTAETHVPSVWCEAGAELRKPVLPKDYSAALYAYSKHMDSCDICKLGGLQEVYSHPVVAETVKILGGRDVIITDNPTSDRARFIDAYREIVARERTKTAMLPEVKNYVAEKSQNLIADGVKQLAKGLSK
jgi:hypothetical protein